MKIDKLFFAGQMDLGDAFVHTGIINYLADRCEELHVPVQQHNYETLKTLFKDHPAIKVVSLKVHEEDEYVRSQGMSRTKNTCLLETGYRDDHKATFLWDEQVYTYYDLPFSYRYTNFRLPVRIDGSEELYKKLYNNRPYILIHRRTGHRPEGLPINIENFRSINKLPQDVDVIEITPDITDNMMHYVKLIENASEIHCVPSSFFVLVDSIYNRTNAKLFYHDCRAAAWMRVNSEHNRFRWTVVNYSKRF